MNQQKTYGILSIPVIVAALGYFVDIYDLLLSSITRIESLRSFNLTPEQITSEGEGIIMWQMAGLFIGGIIWGVMGDKKGRLSVLFGSIVLYSLANIANGGVQPPAIGVDFFEGPFQDAVNVDNPLTTDCNAGRAGLGIPYKGIGIGYGDGVEYNERYGMRAFLYHNNASGNAATQDPSIAIDYYNFLRGIWKDNSASCTVVPGT